MPKNRLIVVGLVVVIGAWIYAITRGQTARQPRQASASISPARAVTPTGCQPHIEVYNAAHWARELGTTEALAQANHRINLWDTPSGGNKRAVGQLLVGSRAVIVNETTDAYQVQSPAGSVGWISKIQVARTLKQDIDTRRACD